MKLIYLAPTWSILRLIGRSRLAQATIFIPIVGYFVLFNEQITKYLRLLPTLAEAPREIDEYTLGRLLCLYIGLFCIGIGSILFQMCSPREIADNKNEHEFSTGELDLMTSYRFYSMRNALPALQHCGTAGMRPEIARLLEIQLSDTVGHQGMELGDLRGRGLAWQDWQNRNRNDLISVCEITYKLLDYSKWFWRTAITLFYVVGFVFLLYPSAQVFFRALVLLKQFSQSLVAW